MLGRLHALLTRKYSASISEWMCKEWQLLEHQTFDLINYLVKTKRESKKNYNILTLARAVSISGHIKSFVIVSKGFLHLPSSKLMLDWLKETRNDKMQKLDFDSYCSLQHELSKDTMQHMLEENKDVLMEKPLIEWCNFLHQLKSKAQITEVGSIQACMDEMIAKFGRLETGFDRSMAKGSAISTILETSKLSPNNLQFALAQYAVGKVAKSTRQLWVVPAGQGKSRISHTMVLLLLLGGLVPKVHMVFSTERLLNRDKAEFHQFWLLSGVSDKVFYHLGIGSSFASADLLIVDESDSIIFKYPVAFNALLTKCRCICLTATPDDNNLKGAERQVLKALGLIKYQHGFPSELSAPAVVNEIMDFQNDEALMEFIKQRLDTMPILLYCSQATKDYISQVDYPCMFADGENVDEVMLRDLDKRQDEGSAFWLVVATQEESMRGIDYRAPVNGITLIIAKSFENSREADQGLKRVGRQNDPCQRLLLKNVPLIDPVLEDAYNVRLLASCRKITKEPLGVMAPLGSLQKLQPVGKACPPGSLTNTNQSTYRSDKRNKNYYGSR